VGATVAGFAFLFLILSILFRRYRRKREERGSVASVSLVPDQSTISQPTSGHISPFQNPTSGSGSGSGLGDPGLPTNVPWPYNPYNTHVATDAFGNALAIPTTLAAMAGPTQTLQPQYIIQNAQSPSPEYYAQQAPGELAARQMDPLEADTIHQAPGELSARQMDPLEADTIRPQPGGPSILPDRRIYPNPQELGRHTPSRQS
jgi:hypothetical protein